MPPADHLLLLLLLLLLLDETESRQRPGAVLAIAAIVAPARFANSCPRGRGRESMHHARPGLHRHTVARHRRSRRRLRRPRLRRRQDVIVHACDDAHLPWREGHLQRRGGACPRRTSRRAARPRAQGWTGRGQAWEGLGLPPNAAPRLCPARTTRMPAADGILRKAALTQKAAAMIHAAGEPPPPHHHRRRRRRHCCRNVRPAPWPGGRWPLYFAGGCPHLCLCPGDHCHRVRLWQALSFAQMRHRHDLVPILCLWHL